MLKSGGGVNTDPITIIHCVGWLNASFIVCHPLSIVGAEEVVGSSSVKTSQTTIIHCVGSLYASLVIHGGGQRQTEGGGGVKG